jgi:capsular exopolysaccharide synthesis family protein
MAELDSLQSDESFRLREYLGALRVRKWSILLITLVTTALALVYAQRQDPTYKSTAKVLATNPLAALGTANSLAAPNMETEKTLVTSTDVTKCAAQIVYPPAATPVASASPQPSGSASPSGGGSASPQPSGSASGPSASPSGSQTGGTGSTPAPAGQVVDLNQVCSDEALATVEVPAGFRQGLTVTVEAGASVLDITDTSTDRVLAQAKAQAFADAYVFYKTTVALETVDTRRKPLEDQLANLTKRQGELITAIADCTASGQNCAAQTSELNTVNSQIAQIQAQLLNLDPAAVIGALPIVVQDAPLPVSPAGPNKPLIAAVGLFLGLAFGIGQALLRERLDNRLKGRQDLEAALGAPVLSVVPRVSGWRRKEETKLVTLDEPKSAVAESYRTLRTSVLFTAVQRGMKTLMVVSAQAGEGKTTTACNLAVSLADANKRVIILSADLRKPRLHRFFGLTNDAGLASVLAGEVKPWEALQKPGVENLRVMASGPVPARPAELLQSEQMGELLTELREVADLIILDTAPVLLVADALGLAPLVDGVLFVADAENTSSAAISHAREQLEQVSAPLIGAVLNNFDPQKARSYGYGYGYGYRYRYGSPYGYGASYGRGYEDGASSGRRARARSGGE